MISNKNKSIIALGFCAILFLLFNLNKISRATKLDLFSPINIIILLVIFFIVVPVIVKIRNRKMK